MHNKVQRDNQLLLLLQMDQKNCFYTLIRIPIPLFHFNSVYCLPDFLSHLAPAKLV